MNCIYMTKEGLPHSFCIIRFNHKTQELEKVILSMNEYHFSLNREKAYFLHCSTICPRSSYHLIKHYNLYKILSPNVFHISTF